MSLGIADALNEHYRTQASLDSLDRWRPRPSALGGCLREMAFLLKGEVPKEPRSPESMRLLELGHQRGEELERRCKAIWPDAEVQVPVLVPTPWGSMAGTVDLWLPSMRTIVDFKTAGAYSMGLVLAGEKEDEGYALQLNAYRHGIFESWREKELWELWLTPALSFGDIRTVLVYEAKDSDARKGVTAGMLHEVEVPYTAELEAAYQAKLWQIGDLLNLKKADALIPENVDGMPRDAKGKEHWKCRMKGEKPLYCSIGPIRGGCG